MGIMNNFPRGTLLVGLVSNSLTAKSSIANSISNFDEINFTVSRSASATFLAENASDQYGTRTQMGTDTVTLTPGHNYKIRALSYYDNGLSYNSAILYEDNVAIATERAISTAQDWVFATLTIN